MYAEEESKELIFAIFRGECCVYSMLLSYFDVIVTRPNSEVENSFAPCNIEKKIVFSH